MDIAKFETEHFFGPYEFTVPHLLSVSDCESVSVGELLELAGSSTGALDRLDLHYTEPFGHPELRRAIAATYDDVPVDAVMVLGSPIEGIYITMRALLEPGDEVVVLSPCYDALFHVADHICDTVHRWELVPDAAEWSMDLAALDSLLGPATKLVIVNFPHNPTGFLPRREQFDDLLRMVDQSGASLFCDEMYRGLEFGDAARLPSAADCTERGIVLSGLSKAYGLPGLRTGWLVCRDAAVRERLENWKYYTSICASAPSEFLATAALHAGDALLAKNNSTVRDNVAAAERFFAGEAAAGRFTWRPPQAGSVALVEVDPSLAPSTTQWCHELAADPGVLLLPGACMGAADRFVRFGFGRRGFDTALEVLAAAIRPRSS